MRRNFSVPMTINQTLHISLPGANLFFLPFLLIHRRSHQNLINTNQDHKIPRQGHTYRVAGPGTFDLGESRHFRLEDVHLLHQGGESSFCGLTHLLVNPFGL